MSANSETDGSQLPHPSYEETKRKSYGSQQEVADAWADGKFPTHNVFQSGEAVLYTGNPEGNRTGSSSVMFGRRRGERSGSRSSSSTGDGPKGKSANFYGVQEPDGTGTLWHYRTREAWRTHSGLIVSNQQCWSSGFAHCSVPEDYEASLPYSALVSLDKDPYEVQRVIGQPDTVTYEHSDRTHTVRRARNSIAVFEDGSAVAIGRDYTATTTELHFVFELEEDELQRFEEVYDSPDSDDVEAFIEGTLMPDEVASASTGCDIVGAHEYTRSRLSDEEQDAHTEAGGSLSRSQSKTYGTHDMLNLQNFRADLQGEVIVRQGEWFFIPRPDVEDVPEAGTRHASSALGSHRAQRFHGARAPLPTECPECGSQPIEVGEDGEVSCGDCGADIEPTIFVRGLVSHSRNEHNQIHLGETWHEAVTHGRDVLTYDENPGNGGGGGGWD